MSVHNNSNILELLNRIQQTAGRLKDADSIKHALFINSIKELINEYFSSYGL